jgi:PAS domain S-box-containing protein
MNPMTAVSFLLLSISFLFLYFSKQLKGIHEIAGLFGFIAFVIGLLKLGQLFFGWPVHVDQILFTAALEGKDNPIPNRMAPNTAFNIMMFGLAVLFLDWKRIRSITIAHGILVLVNTITLLAIFGYIYNAANLYGLPSFVPMALHVAFSFLILCFAFFNLAPDEGIANWFIKTFARTSLSLKINVGLILGLLVIGLVSLVSYTSTQQLIRSTEELNIALKRIEATKDLHIALLDAETGQRGYIITGDENYLVPFNNGIANYKAALVTVKSLAKPEDKETVNEIEKMSQEKADELYFTIETRRTKGNAAAEKLVDSHLGKNIMDGIRMRLKTLDASEKEIVTQLDTLATKIARITIVTVILGSTLGLFFVVVAIFIINEEIRKQKEAEKKLKEAYSSIALAKSKDEAILSGIGDAVFVVDSSHNIILFNNACELISGYTAKEALGKDYKDILHFVYENTDKLNDGFIKKAFETGKVTEMANHTMLVRKDGTRVDVSDSAAPVFDERKKIIGCVIVFRDVSHERQIDKAKTEFVSLASHQLRTPLSAIGWYTELLMSGDAGKLTKEQQEYASEVYNANKRMVELVNSLLNVSRIDLGTFMVEPKEVDIVKTAKSMLAELKPTIIKKKIKIKEDYEKSLPMIMADPKLTQIIFQNLLSNAVKYTDPEGTVSVSIHKDSKNDAIQIDISDTGYGIPKNQQDNIFTKLFRADNVRVKQTEGTGLGMYIVKAIIDQAKGKIWFESEENKGTTFHVLLPLKGMKKRDGAKELT